MADICISIVMVGPYETVGPKFVKQSLVIWNMYMIDEIRKK